jgi:heterodisulfide reductase subunit C
MGSQMDLLPNQLIRLVQLGRVERAATCEAIWQCVSCQTCTSRCPQSVDCAAAMDALRQLASEGRVAAAGQKRTWSFHQEFLRNIRRNGRLNEIELIGAFKTRSFADDWNVARLLKDAWLAPRLMRRGKLHLVGKRVRDRDVVRRIFDRCRAAAPEGEDGQR